MESLGKVIVVIGVVLVILGLGIWFLGDRFDWFGNLPGDVRIQGENFSCFAPITSMIIVSIVLSIVLSLIVRFFR